MKIYNGGAALGDTERGTVCQFVDFSGKIRHCYRDKTEP